MQISGRVKKLLRWFFILAVIIVSRLPSFLGGFVNIDENEYAIAGMKILAGGLPYRDFLIYQPPVIYYFYALGFWLFGSNNLHGVHFLLQAVVFLSAIFIYLSAKKIFSERAGWVSAFFYSLVSFMFLPQDMLAANCEILAVLPAVAAVWLYFGHSLYFLAGCAVSFAFLTKYQCGIVLLPLLFSAIFVRKNIASALSVLAGFFLPIAVVYLALNHYGAGTAAKEAFLYITLYAKGPVQADIWYVIIKFAVRTFLIALACAGVWYLAIKALFSRPEGLRYEERAFFVVWLFSSFAPVIMGGRIYFHYYFTALPVIAMLAGSAFSNFGLSKKLKFIFIGWGVFIATGYFIYDIYKPHRKITVKDEWIYVVDHLRNKAVVGDSLFVWGYCPQIYVSSGLSAGTRFTTADYLTGRTPMTAGLEYDPLAPEPPSAWKKVMNDFIDPPGVVVFDTSKNIFPKAWEYLKEDFEKGLPTYIVDTAPSNYRRYGRYPIQKYPYLNEIILKKYSLTADVKGYRIYKIK